VFGVSKHFGKAARAPGSERASESGKLDGDLLAGRLPARVESFLSRRRDLGQVNREGVGYATIQDVLLGGLGIAPLLGLLWACKLVATPVSLGSGSSGGIFSPSLFMGATLGGAFGAFAKTILPWAEPEHSRLRHRGYGAMVGGGTGAAMTAVTMIFEMTRDYDIVMPMIIAVAVSIGIRRVLSHENITRLSW
jgi:chloride channel protein, CIC family